MKLLASHCVFPTPDIHKTAEYYVKKLGFRRVDYLDAKEKHICLYRDGVEFILTQANTQRVFPNRELYGYGEDAYVITESQQELQRCPHPRRGRHCSGVVSGRLRSWVHGVRCTHGGRCARRGGRPSGRCPHRS